MAYGPNQVPNPSYELWTGGTAGPPDSWQIFNLTAAQRESVEVQSGTYSAAIVGYPSGSPFFYWTVTPLGSFNGKTMVFGGYVKTSTANLIRPYIYADGHTYGGYHSGGGGWELLLGTKIFPGTTSLGQCGWALGTSGAAIVAYADNCFFSEYIPDPVISDVSSYKSLLGVGA